MLVGGSLETLPGESTSQEIQENMAERLEIITARLFPSQVGVDAHVAGCAGQRFPLAIRDMLLGLGISVLLGHSEIDNVDYISGFGTGATDEEVVRLDIAIDQVLLVDSLDSRQLLEVLEIWKVERTTWSSPSVWRP